MKRFLVLFVIGALLATGAVLLLPRVISAERVAAELVDEVEKLSGLTATRRGEARFVTFPWPRVFIRDLELSQPDTGQVVARIPSTELDIRIRDLITGRVTQRRARIVRPDVTLNLDAAGTREEARPRGTIARAVEAALRGEETAPSAVRLGRLTIVDGRFSLVDNVGGTTTDLTDIDLTIDLLALDRPVTVSGGLVRKGERVTGALSLASPQAFLSGNATPMTTDLSSPVGTISFDGTATFSQQLLLDGRLVAGAPALDRWLAWMGYAVEDLDGLEGVAVTSDISVVGRALSFVDMSIGFDGNQGSGSLTVMDHPDGLNVAGTLDFDTLDLTRAFGLGNGELDAETSPYDAVGQRIAKLLPETLSADIRLSARTLRIATARLARVAATANVIDRQVTIGLAEARFHGGRASGTLTLTPLVDAHKVTLMGTLRNVDIGDLVDASTIMALDGAASASLNLSGIASTETRFLKALTGTAEIVVEGGQLRGLDLVRMARALEAGNMDGLRPDRRTATQFESLLARFEIANGRARSETFAIRGDEITLEADAQVMLEDWTLAGRGALAVSRAPSADTDDSEPVRLPFVLTGELGHPLILPDLNRLLRDQDSDRGELGPAGPEITPPRLIRNAGHVEAGE
ncbi:MAG: AsmA family protein [Pseudomonadota bacterium]